MLLFLAYYYDHDLLNKKNIHFRQNKLTEIKICDKNNKNIKKKHRVVMNVIVIVTIMICQRFSDIYTTSLHFRWNFYFSVRSSKQNGVKLNVKCCYIRWQINLPFSFHFHFKFGIFYLMFCDIISFDNRDSYDVALIPLNELHFPCNFPNWCFNQIICNSNLYSKKPFENYSDCFK